MPGATGRCGVLGVYAERRAELVAAELLFRSRSFVLRPGFAIPEGGAPIVLDSVHGSSNPS